jgi:hypothetical protein
LLLIFSNGIFFPELSVSAIKQMVSDIDNFGTKEIMDFCRGTGAAGFPQPEFPAACYYTGQR